jgi:hypothetical protein
VVRAAQKQQPIFESFRHAARQPSLLSDAPSTNLRQLPFSRFGNSLT